ncbi:MAG: ABC transporter permease subunit [Deltaproteobacteria bacterium]|nr:ABC transporter permease subunit [Deltaproteobacteria bacterium]
MDKKPDIRLFLILLPTVTIVAYFFVYPITFLFYSGLKISKESLGLENYLNIIFNLRYRRSMLNSIFLSLGVTFVTMVLSLMLTFFLARYNYMGKKIMVALVNFPLAFPGVVVGFMVIILFGHTGLLGQITEPIFGKKISFAYKLSGLFVAYLYFSIPRVTFTMISAIKKLDLSLEEAARSLGASEIRTLFQVIFPMLVPALVAGSALCFATSMGAFGTAFTLAEQFEILPMLVYTETTLSFNINMASALSIVLGLITYLILTLNRILGVES